MPSITPRADSPAPDPSSITSQSDNPTLETTSSESTSVVAPGQGGAPTSNTSNSPSETPDPASIDKATHGPVTPISSNTSSTASSSSPTSSSQPSTASAITSPTSTASTSATSTTSVMSSGSSSAISASNATISSPKSSHSSSGSSSISSGALAGGIIGAFAVGILLALMAAYLFNKQKDRKAKRAAGDPRGSVAGQYKGTAYEKVPGPGLAASSWERFLPQSIDDQSMKASVQSLLNQINLHVDNFYARSDVAVNTSVTENLARIDTGLLPSPLPALMTGPKMQLLAIKHCIARIVTTRMLPGSDLDTTLLPPHLAAVPEKLQPDVEGGKETPATRQAYCQWKVLNSYLYPEAETSTAMLAQQRNASMAIIKSVTAAFSHWETKPTEGPSAAEHLAQIIDVARGVGATIMSQASSFDWRWRLSPRQHGAEPLDHFFVVFPGFVKITDEKGRTLERAQTLVRALTQESSGSA